MTTNHPCLKKAKSLIDGDGIFTTKLIKKGEKFYIIPVDNIVNVPTPRFAHIGKGQYVCDEAVLNWVNHSCNPSAILDISTDHPCLKAAQDILPGEEITCDYDKTEAGGTEAACNCGDKKCRGRFLRIQ